MTSLDRPITEPTLRAVTSWWYIATVTILIANDHVLKELFPGVITGKVSDFAGLFFFPLLLLTISLPILTLVGWRWLAIAPFAVTGLLFGALKLDSSTSRTIVEWMQAVSGLPLRVVADPTDLVAIVSVGAAFMYWRRELDRPPRTRPGARYGHVRLAVVLLASAMATTATSRVPPPEIIALAAHRSSAGEVYALASADTTGQDEHGGLYRTTDGGLGWRRVAGGGHAMAADPTHPGAVFILRDEQLYRFENEQSGLVALGPPLGTFPSQGVRRFERTQLAVSASGVVYLWREGRAVRFDRALGVDAWSTLKLPGDVAAIAGGTRSDLAVADGRLWRSVDRGESWQEVATFRLSDPVIAVDPTDDAHLLAGLQNGLLRSVDGGRTWHQVWGSERPGVRQSEPRWTIVFDHSHEDRIYATVAGGRTPLLVSADGGATWRASELAARTVTLTAAPDHALFISSGERGVYRQGSAWPELEPWRGRSNGLPTR